MNRGQSPSSWVGLSLVTGIGVTIVIFLLIGLYLGKWLDAQTGAAPLFTVAGLLVGVAAGSYSAYRQVLAAETRKRGRDDG